MNVSNISTKLSWERPLGSYARVQNVVAALIRNTRMQLAAHRGAEYLNVGCGPELLPGFCNLDYLWRPGVLCWDVTRGIPFQDATLRGIFTEHCLEHIPRSEGQLVLKEFKRVLLPGGIARVVVPDGELYCRLYIQAIEGHDVRWPYPDPQQTAMGQVNRIMREHEHRFIYDFETLRKSMLEAGFREVHKASFKQGREPRLLVDQQHRAGESLYVEGVA